jgi:hypothetical protein
LAIWVVVAESAKDASEKRLENEKQMSFARCYAVAGAWSVYSRHRRLGATLPPTVEWAAYKKFYSKFFLDRIVCNMQFSGSFGDLLIEPQLVSWN